MGLIDDLTCIFTKYRNLSSLKYSVHKIALRTYQTRHVIYAFSFDQSVQKHISKLLIIDTENYKTLCEKKLCMFTIIT